MSAVATDGRSLILAAPLRHAHGGARDAAGVLDRGLGRRYRDTILAKGRSIEPDALLEEFLRRQANDAAFLKKLGVE